MTEKVKLFEHSCTMEEELNKFLHSSEVNKLIDIKIISTANNTNDFLVIYY